MRRALELAEQAHGRTGDNPWVGCVIVKDGKMLGEGYTHPPGQDHAEAAALRGPRLVTTSFGAQRSTAHSNPARFTDAPPPARNCSSARVSPVCSLLCVIHTPRSTGLDSKSCAMVVLPLRRACLPRRSPASFSRG